MSYSFDYAVLAENPSMDPKLVAQIQRSPTMMAEQGGGFMLAYGGPSLYQTLARLPTNQRLVYAAALDGYSSQEEISAITGLKSTSVATALTGLSSKGLVTAEIP